MTLKKYLFFGIINVLCLQAYCQEKNYFSFELAGSGGFGSINYEHPIYQKGKLTLNMRYGFSFTPIDKNNGTVLIFPVMLHALIGENSHKLDLAVGQTFSITTRGAFFLITPLAIGYRYQPNDKNYYFRCSYTPLVSYLIDFQWQHWGGITYGYHFNRKK